MTVFILLAVAGFALWLFLDLLEDIGALLFYKVDQWIMRRKK